MKVSWIIALLSSILFAGITSRRFSGPTKNFIFNKRMHHSGSLRNKVSKYLKKMTPLKRKQIRKKYWEKKMKMHRLENRKHFNFKRNYAKHEKMIENKVHRKMKKFEVETQKRRRKLKKIKMKKDLQKRRRDKFIRKKKEKRNLDELRKRMAKKSKGKTLDRGVYPVAKTVKPHLIRQKNQKTLRSRFLKNEKNDKD